MLAVRVFLRSQDDEARDADGVGTSMTDASKSETLN